MPDTETLTETFTCDPPEGSSTPAVKFTLTRTGDEPTLVTVEVAGYVVKMADLPFAAMCVAFTQLMEALRERDAGATEGPCAEEPGPPVPGG